jgi:hypothetical protein
MKILIIIMLVLFLSPVAAQAADGYETSGGYEKSGGYESSGGYETSGGYEASSGYGRSEGYETSDSFLYGKSGGYASFKFQHDERPSGTHRKSSRLYDVQRAKDSLKKGAWLKERMNATNEHQWIRQNERFINREQRRMGGIWGRQGTGYGLR